ncbi:TldD/PmbA family protein [uncultured Faecalicoccus sp.]|uniref:TldD/PmbA family protein n=1 Tax=uncultured Faecalicoccus sp. TaxID=1971760 RepID=UPI00260A23D0|nr:TldD/PmbA family protein [uncultured Faecalicoccus sp.]
MLTKDQCEKILSYCMASEADFAELFEEHTTSESISMLNGEIEETNRVIRAGIGIRLYKDVQSVYGYTNEMEMEKIFTLADDLKAVFGISEEERSVSLKEQKMENRHPVLVDPIDAPLSEKVKLLERAYKTGKEESEKIVKITGSMRNSRQNVQISNSDGRFVQDVRVKTRMAITAYAKEKENMQTGSDGPGASQGLEFYEHTTPESIAKEACRTALVLLKAKDCPSGKMPVIIDNGFGGVIFHEACGHSLEATSVAKNQSVFSDKIGEKIASSCVTAIDDGTIPNAWGSENIDDEGNPQQKRVLIKDGILENYMIDQLNGRRMNRKSTGSSRRESYKYEPTSRMSNTYIAAGTDRFEDLFKGIKKGLYARKMGGGSVNPQTGEFNFAVNEGYMIEEGKITYPVKGASLIGNGKDILMNIDMVSDNVERAQGMCGSCSGSIPVDVGQPAIRVSSITVGGTANE